MRYAAVILLLLLLLMYSIHRMRKYPLAKGIRALALISVSPVLVNLPFIRISNRFLRSLPVPSPLPGQDRIICPFRADDGYTLRLVIYRPRSDGKLPCLLYFHGGGFFFETAPYQYRNMREYAENAGCIVVSLQYRTSDSNPFPRPLKDCIAALRFMLENAEELGIDASRIAVGGDSAGGCLAASLALWARDNGIKLRAQLLIYPVLDRSLSTDSAITMTDSPVWSSRLSSRMWEIYQKNGDEGLPHYLLSPFSASDLSSLPPSYIEIGQYDSLRDEGQLYARRLEEAGCHVVLNDIGGVCHGFDFISHSPIARKAVKERSEVLKKFFS